VSRVMEENRSNVFCSLIIIMVMMEGCYCGENNNKRDGGLGGEDVKVHCGMGYYPAWDNDCVGVDGCREIEIKRCGCHCKKCYFDKCVEVGCKEPCEVGYYDVEEVRDNEVFEVEEEAWVDGVVRDAEVEDVSELEDVYNPYGPHFKPIPDSKVGMNLRIEGDLVIWTTIGNGIFDVLGFLDSDICYYNISMKERRCLNANKAFSEIWTVNLNNNKIICWDSLIRSKDYRFEISIYNLNTNKSKLLFSSESAANYAINSRYVIYSDDSSETEDIFYSYDISSEVVRKLSIKDCRAYDWGYKFTSDKYMVFICEGSGDRYYLFEEDKEFFLDEYFKPYEKIGYIFGDIYENLLSVTIGPDQPTSGDIYIFDLGTKEMIPVYTADTPELGGRFCSRNIIMWNEAVRFDSGPYKVVLYDIETKVKRYVTKDYGGWIGDCDGKYMILCPDCLGSLVGSVLYLLDLEEMGLIKDGHVVPE